jgi:predicted SAM-dependent methyltransferase
VEYGNIVKGLPLVDGTCKGVYASHVLEHLPLEDFHIALENTRRILIDGGIFRLVVPDLESAARAYCAGLDAGETDANSSFLRETNLGEEKVSKNAFGFLYSFLKTSRHYWMWDAISLENALTKHGFVKVRRCHFNDCEDPMFSLVEDAGRFVRSVAMEARR